MSDTLKNAALVIVGHGSTVNPDSSEPTLRHADAIRRRGIFREVVCCFWKEEPSMREVYDMLESEVVYVVPNFISEGYFCQEVLPRELRVTPPESVVEGKRVRYCDPVGVHPSMQRLLLQRADEVAPGVPRGETSLIIVGHGTNLNDNSTKAIKAQVELIGGGGHGFAEVVEAYMEEAPLVADWDQLTTAPNVVVVPFFIADGLHSYQDIPVLLGMAEEIGEAASASSVFKHNPNALRGRQLYYSGAIGTADLMAEVILDQVATFDEKHGAAEGGVTAGLRAWLKGRVEAGRCEIGEVLIRKDGNRYQLCHCRDEAAKDLTVLLDLLAARQLAWRTADGKFRALKSAPTLQQGWTMAVADLETLLLVLDTFYPAAVGMAMKDERGELGEVPLRDFLGRQTGMYRFANGISDDQACQIVSQVCDSASRCTRRIRWGLTSDQPLYGPALGKTQATGAGAGIPLLCKEACPHFIGVARKVARENHEAAAKDK